MRKSQGECNLMGRDLVEAYKEAFDDALDNFEELHGREPIADSILFSGAATTLKVVCEIEEEVEDYVTNHYGS